MANNKPIKTIRDGQLKAAIWKNEGEKGSFYSVRITRLYKDEGGAYQDSDRFSGAELLRLARLAGQAYDCTVAFHQAQRSEAES